MRHLVAKRRSSPRRNVQLVLEDDYTRTIGDQSPGKDVRPPDLEVLKCFRGARDVAHAVDVYAVHLRERVRIEWLVKAYSHFLTHLDRKALEGTLVQACSDLAARARRTVARMTSSRYSMSAALKSFRARSSGASCVSSSGCCSCGLCASDAKTKSSTFIFRYPVRVTSPSASGLYPLFKRESKDGLTPMSFASCRQDRRLLALSASNAAYSAGIFTAILDIQILSLHGG